MKSCGRHQCRRRCCDGDCPPCDLPCGRRLRCGNHLLLLSPVPVDIPAISYRVGLRAKLLPLSARSCALCHPLADTQMQDRLTGIAYNILMSQLQPPPVPVAETVTSCLVALRANLLHASARRCALCRSLADVQTQDCLTSVEYNALFMLRPNYFLCLWTHNL